MKYPKVLMLGLSYKKNIDDIRNSPAIQIFSNLKDKIRLSFNDKFVKILKIGKRQISSKKIKDFSSVKLYDAVILATDHDYFDYKKILKYSALIIDLRNKFLRSKKVIKL